MSYHGFNRGRASAQIRTMIEQNSYTAVWCKYVSATSGVPAAGIGSAYYYSTAIISGLFGNRSVEQVSEHQSPAGLIAAGDIYSVTREQIGRRDIIFWRGSQYRVEGDPVPVRMSNNWIVGLKRVTT